MEHSLAQNAVSLLTLLTTTIISPAPSASMASLSVVTPQAIPPQAASKSATLEEQLKVRFDTLEKNSTPSAEEISPIPSAPPKRLPQAPTTLTEEQLTYLGNCESGMTATRNSGNGYYGAFQFSAGTWNSMGTGYERADLAPLEVQKEAVQRLLARSSIYTQFPGCASKMQAEGIL